MKKFNTTFETAYIKRKDGFYQKVIRHFIHFADTSGKMVSKLDNEIPSGLYREAMDWEHSIHGEAEIIDGNGQKVRLIAMGEPRKW